MMPESAPEPTDGDDAIWNTAARFADETLTQGETEAARIWRQADARHEAAYQRMLRISDDQALRQALMNFDLPKPKPAWQRPAVVYGFTGAIAACLCLVFAAPYIADAVTPASIYATRPGEVRDIRLSDGSQVTLNGDSRLEARLTGFRRNVTLTSGEAYFAVAHDKSRPFDVHLDSGTVRVVGTEFNLSYLPDGVELDVYNGKVRLTGDQRRFGLYTRGMRARLEAGEIQPLSTFDPQATDWRTGWIEPANWPLERVAKALSRHSGLTIRFGDETLKHKRIVGRVRLDDPVTQLEALAQVHDFSVVRDGNVITVR